MKNTKIRHVTFLFVSAFLLTAINIIVVPDAAYAEPPACKGHKKNDDGCDGSGGGGGGGAGDIQTCDEVFGATSGPIGSCTCTFKVQVKESSSGTPPQFAYTLQDNCQTDTMLVVPVYGSILGTGFTLDAVNGAAGFSGEAVVTNEGFRAVIQDLTINIDNDAANGCNGTLQAGILYSIDNTTPPEDPLHPAVRLLVQRNIIKSQVGTSVCRGIEATRTPTDNVFIDRFTRVNGNEIWPSSYAETGILVRGFGPSDSTGSEITASKNNVARGLGGGTTAMQIGPASADAVSLRTNVLAAGPDGAGLAIFGAGVVGPQIDVLRNNVAGGKFGIMVDESVWASDVTGNSLNGDGVAGSIAVCDDSVIPLDQRNKSMGYQFELVVGGCSSLLPAN